MTAFVAAATGAIWLTATASIGSAADLADR